MDVLTVVKLRRVTVVILFKVRLFCVLVACNSLRVHFTR